jgi:sensor c-di-GMP phosphodiesterase-like protein
MNRLKESNIRFPMDDFGTGYSSLSNLNRLPLDELKIDRAFIKALTYQDGDRVMVTTILKMASILMLSIVAEGVETEGQLEFFKHHDCPIFQGYYYSQPLPKDQFVAYYRSRQSSGEGVTAFS